MQINKIIKMKNNKYKIVMENEIIITYDNVILENNLLYKKSIDESLYKKILLDTEYYDIYNKTVKYILKRRRSEKDTVEYLNKLGTNEDSIKSIITKLKSIKLIDDKQFCKAYINDKLYLSKVGINKIINDLLEQNIPIDVINESLEKIDKEVFKQRLEKMIIKKIRTNNKYSNYNLKQKILNDMIKLGYNKDDIINIFDNNIKDDSEILKGEFNKIYNNLSKKHTGYELKNKVMQKLISKGFKVDEVNLLLQKNTED